MYIVYGIPNCDTIRKTTDWLKQNKIAFEFHDYKKSGISVEKLKQWSDQVGWETLLNKKGTTWRGLSPEAQAKINTAKQAIKLMAEQTSSIKRPVIEKNGKIVVVGFNAAQYQQLITK
jgi:Spx/MgsR family transcriptional regulator